MLNPTLDRKALAKTFIIDDRVRVETVLIPEIAERVRQDCQSALPFDYIFTVDGRPCVKPAQEMVAMDARTMRELQQSIASDAAQGIGYLYCGYRMRQARRNGEDDQREFLHSVVDYFNSEQMIDFVSEVCGCDDLQSADAQYTRYTSGQFLTRHKDAIVEEGRRIAYVLSLSPDWHPDWGGLLQFYTDDGTPRDAWAPKFNSLTLFDVRHVHAVTCIAPFAPAPRLSLTGWFLNKPL